MTKIKLPIPQIQSQVITVIIDHAMKIAYHPLQHVKMVALQLKIYLVQKRSVNAYVQQTIREPIVKLMIAVQLVKMVVLWTETRAPVHVQILILVINAKMKLANNQQEQDAGNVMQ